MIFIFILGFPPQPLQGRPLGRRGPRGGFSPILPMKMKIILEFTTIETPESIKHMIFGGMRLNPL